MTTDSPNFASKARGTMRAMVEHVLRQESRLAASTREYGWRVRGSPLQSIKRLFAEQGRQVDAWLRDLNERARTLGIAVAVAAPAAETDVAEIAAPGTAIAELLTHHESILRDLRDAVDAEMERDPQGETAVLLKGLLDFHETSAWMLRLILDSPERARVVAR